VSREDATALLTLAGGILSLVVALVLAVATWPAWGSPAGGTPPVATGRRRLVAAVVVVVVFLAAAALLKPVVASWMETPSAPTAEIKNPPPWSAIDAQDYPRFQAELHHVPAGYTPWVIIHELEGSGRYHPNNVECPVHDRVMICEHLYVGPDAARAPKAGLRHYEIMVVAIDARARAAIDEYNKNAVPVFAGLQFLPQGTMLLQSVTVIRRFSET